ELAGVARYSAPSLRSFCPALRLCVRQLQNRHSLRRQNRRSCGCFRPALTIQTDLEGMVKFCPREPSQWNATFAHVDCVKAGFRREFERGAQLGARLAVATDKL